MDATSMQQSKVTKSGIGARNTRMQRHSHLIARHFSLMCCFLVHPSLQSAADAVAKMLEHNVGSIAVTRRGRCTGVLLICSTASLLMPYRLHWRDDFRLHRRVIGIVSERDYLRKVVNAGKNANALTVKARVFL